MKKIFAILLVALLLGVLGWKTWDKEMPTKELREEAEAYTILAKYPNKPEVEAHVQDIVQQFKKENDFENLTAEDIETLNLGGTRKYTLEITTAIHTAPGYTSYVLNVYADQLGAHGNTNYQTFTYKNDGTEVKLPDLFKPGSKYLEKLSALSYQAVTEEYARRGYEFEEEWVRTGTEPREESFQSWYLEGEKLYIIFPPYYVGPYSMGTFTISIPLADLQSILR